MSDRLRYYNPFLDNHVVTTKMTPKMATAAVEGKYPDVDTSNLHQPDLGHEANCWSSLCVDGLHRPALDIDIPMTVLPSSTPGHGHLFFDVPMIWEHYEQLLDVLAIVGILESGYVGASKARRQTILRLPHVTKPVIV